jgi:hypothetical protein
MSKIQAALVIALRVARQHIFWFFFYSFFLFFMGSELRHVANISPKSDFIILEENFDTDIKVTG